MAFEVNDLKGILIMILFAIPMVASTNINCSGRAFHCLNSTHFMICVDLGGGLSTTIDDFVIPCPAATVCHENNVFECDFPEVTTPSPPLQVIGVYKQSDTSESTSVTNSVTAPKPTSEIFSVFKENITATTLSIPEDVTPVVKLEVLENIKDSIGVNSDNTTEARIKVTSSFNDSTNEVNDKQTNNKTITISATDNNNHLESAAETSIHKPVNTSSTDKSKSIDKVTSIIGLINLISTDHPTVVNTKPSSDVFTPLDTLYDNIATTTEQYITKQVTTQSEIVENVTEKITIFNERSVTTDEVSTTPVVNTYIESDNNTTEFINKIDSGNQTIAVGKSLGKSNNSSELLPDTTKAYLAPINIVNISEPVTEDLSPKTEMDNTFVPLRLVDFISADPKQNALSTNDYVNTFYGNTATMTTDQYTTKLETTLSDKTVIAEVISTTPTINTVFQKVFKNDVINDSLTDLNSTFEITSMKNIPETNIYFIPEPITIKSLQTTTEKTFVPISTEANIMYTTVTTPKSGDLIKYDLLVEKHTTTTQPLEIIVTTDSPIQPTNNLYQINREINQTMITAINNRTTINTTERVETLFNASSKNIVNYHVTEPTLLPPTSMKNPAIEFTTPETLQNGFTVHALEVENELRATNTPIIVNEPYVENVKNDTLLYNTTNTMNTTETVKAVFDASSEDINNGKNTERSTLKHSPIEISTTETLQKQFTTHVIEAKKLSATNVPISVNEPNTDSLGKKALLNVYTTPAPYNVTSDPVTSTTIKYLTSQSDIAINPKISVIPEIITHTDSSISTNHATTQNVINDPEIKISGSLNQPDTIETTLQKNLKADQWTKTVEGVVGMTTTYRKNTENKATTPLPIDVTEKTSLSDFVKSGNQDNISATSVVTTQIALLKKILLKAPSTVYYVSELASTTPITIKTTPISIDTKKQSEQVSSYIPEIVDIYRASTTGYKIDTSTTLPGDVTHIASIENVTDIPVTLSPQELTSQEISTVKQLNTYSTTTETYSDVVPFTVATAGYVLNTKNIDTNISNQTDSVNIISKDNSTVDINKTETVNPINSKKSVNATSFASTEKPNKDESIKIVSLLNIVNSSVNAMPMGTLQPTSSNPPLSNDYIKTTASQDSSAYVTTTNNVTDYNLMQVGESITQKKPGVIKTLAQNNVMHAILSTPSTYILPITEINTENVHSGGIEAPLPSTVELKYIINPTKTAVDYLTETTNYYISSTEAILTKLNKLPKVETESSVSPVSDFTPVTSVSPEPLKTAPVYDGFTTIIDTDIIMSSTKISPKEVTDNNVKISTDSQLLNSKVMDTQTAKYNTESSLPILEVPALQNVFDETTPLEKMNQDVLPIIKIADLPQYVISTANNQSMPSLPILRVTAATQITTEPTFTTNVFAQTTPFDKMNQDVLPGITTTDLPPYVKPTLNNNIPQSMASLPIVGLTAAQMTTEPTFTTNVFAQTTPLDKMNQNVLPETTPAYLPQYVMSTLNNNIPQPMASLPIVEPTAAQMSTESIHITNVISQTTPLLAAAGKANQDGIKTTDLSQDVMTMVIYNNNNTTKWISNVTTEINTDSQTAPDSMVETIEVVGDKVSGTYLGDTTLSDVMPNHATVNNTNYSVKPVKNIFDHEHIVLGPTSKNNEQNTPITSAKSVDINKAEIENHTESNWMRSNVNIDSVKIKESSIEEKDSISSVLKFGADVQNKTLVSDSSIISKIETKDGISTDKIEYRLTTVTTNYKEAESGAPKNVTQPKKIITKENKNAEIDSTVNDIEIIDVKRLQVQVESKNISGGYNINNTKANITILQHNLSLRKSTLNDELEHGGYNINNTKANITILQHNLSLRKSTLNDELEQHLISTNHTITTEVQSHLNESDKQSNKTSDELTLNGTSLHNPNLTRIKLNVGSNDTSPITVSTLVFNHCSNHTRGKYADKKDCRKFYTCIGNLQPLLGTCPNNTVFSEINKQCTRNLSHCVRNNQFRCLLEGRFSDFFKDNIYYICVKNKMNGFIRYKIQCQDDYHLNKDSVKCEKNEEISTQSASSVSETNNDESKPQPKSEKIVSTDDFECENEGKFPYAKNCSKYYVCNEIKNVYYICVKNRMNGFIRYKLQCQDDYHLNKDTVKCEKNEEISIQSTSSVSETNNDESMPQLKSEKIVSTDDFECENEGKFPNAKNCSKYYVCTNIKNVYRRKIKNCASEEVFDKKKKNCVKSDSGEC